MCNISNTGTNVLNLIEAHWMFSLLHQRYKIEMQTEIGFHMIWQYNIRYCRANIFKQENFSDGISDNILRSLLPSQEFFCPVFSTFWTCFLWSCHSGWNVDPSVEQGLTTMRHNWALGRLQDQLVYNKIEFGGELVILGHFGNGQNVSPELILVHLSEALK